MKFSRKLLILGVSLILCSCHYLQSAQWTANNKNKVDRIKLLKVIKDISKESDLEECNNLQEFPNTLLLMRENPVGGQSLDVGVRASSTSYIVDVWAGYGVGNTKFNKIRDRIGCQLQNNFPNLFSETKDPIKP